MANVQNSEIKSSNHHKTHNNVKNGISRAGKVKITYQIGIQTHKITTFHSLADRISIITTQTIISVFV